MLKLILFYAILCSQQLLAIKNNYSANANFLYWTIGEIGADNWAEILMPKALNQTTEFLSLKFKWRPGLRVGVDYIDKNNEWDTSLYYTWYQTHASQAACTTTAEIHSSFSGNFYAQNTLGNGVSGPYYHQANIKWNFLYNNIDGEIARIFTFIKYKLRPFLGIKAAFLNQKINTSWSQPFNNTNKTPITSFSIATENIKNNFYGIGPSFGLAIQSDLYTTNTSTLGLISNFSAAFLWGGWHTSDIYQNNTPVSISTVNNLRSSGLLMTRGLIGVNWEPNIKNFNVIFKLAYEAQMWMNQLKFYSFDGGRQNGTLYTQGGVVNVCMRF